MKNLWVLIGFLFIGSASASDKIDFTDSCVFGEGYTALEAITRARANIPEEFVEKDSPFIEYEGGDHYVEIDDTCENNAGIRTSVLARVTLKSAH